MQDTIVLLNARAGTLLDHGPDAARAAFADAFGARAQVRTVGPRSMKRAILQAARSEHATVIVGGGDGSVGLAAAALAGTGKTLGIVPLGTLNLLARDLGMPQDIAEAIAALAVATPRRIDLASVNGRLFHSLSGMGFFSQMARAREEARDLPGKLLRLGAATVRAFSRMGRFSLTVEIDGRTRDIESYALLVTCNRFGGDDWRRHALDGGTLEVHIARDEGALARLKAGAELIAGGWRDNDGILSVPAKTLRIDRNRRRAWVATDGELSRERMPLVYEIRPKALSVLVPARAAQG